MKLKDLTGLKFGRLTVLGVDHKKPCKNGTRIYWRCRCDCENEVVVLGGSLTSGHTQSCGCLAHEIIIKRNQTHGLRNNKIYNTWSSIKERCFNPNCRNYKDYGGRGITMFSGWIEDFQAFYDYVSKLEHFGEDGYTLDRINNDGNYEPNNIRWADQKTQCRNTRQNVFVEYNGEKMCLMDAAELSGINYNSLFSRYEHGDKGERLFRPVEK